MSSSTRLFTSARLARRTLFSPARISTPNVTQIRTSIHPPPPPPVDPTTTSPPDTSSMILPHHIDPPTSHPHHSHLQGSSIDPSEVSHFSDLAASWWDPLGPSRLLHLMNPLRIDFLTRHCLSRSHPDFRTQPMTYLDIGCGGGILSESLARLPNTKRVTAIDPTPQVLEIAKAHLRQDPPLERSGKLIYINTGIESAPTDQVDVVTAMEVVEHVSNPQEFLKEAAKRVKPGGWLAMSTIARHPLAWVTTKLIAEELWRVVPRGTHDYAKYVNADELEAWVRRCEGFGGSEMVVVGCVYVPGVGWREVRGGEKVGNYFLGARKALE